MNIPFVIHSGEELYQLKLKRNNISIEILQREHCIHTIEQAKGTIFQRSIMQRIEKIKEMNTKETEFSQNPSQFKMNEINDIINEINHGFYTEEDTKNQAVNDLTLDRLHTEIAQLQEQFAALEAKIAEIPTVAVIKGKIHIPSVAEQLGVSESDLKGLGTYE